jgi:1-acyl-sn-glycerol-3-phosphate acyltransferase
MCVQLLENPGNILIFFPEGTRSAGAVPGEFKPGVALLVAGRDIPVVPCHLSGTHAALPKGAWFPRPRAIRLTIGRPHLYAHLPASRQSVRQICRELHEAVTMLGHGSQMLFETRSNVTMDSDRTEAGKEVLTANDLL